MAAIDAQLAALAAAHGVLSTYDDWAGRPVEVPPATVVAVLTALGVDAASDDGVRRSLAAVADREWRQLCPPTVVVTPDQRAIAVHVPAGRDLHCAVELEDGGSLTIEVTGSPVEVRQVGGQLLERWEVQVPPAVDPGYHRLVLRSAERTAESLLVVAPARCPTPIQLGRSWGWMVQLYAVRSAQSWGIGDYRDLAELCRWSGAVGADFVLCNPLHAAAPTIPQVHSPYSPVSRRFHNTLALRAEDIPEAAALNSDGRARLERLAAAGRALTARPRIDRDAVATLQREALELVYAVPLDVARAASLAEFRVREGAGLVDFATWCALTETFGPRWSEWPQELRHPRNPAVQAQRAELASLIDLHVWLQWQCDQQLAEAQATARAAGQRIGVVHDLAVGVGPHGADAWALQDDLALDMTIGAPPDSFNQRGQVWELPPLRPDRLAATGYAAFRDMLRSVLRHAGGIRIDHAMGLFRLFWVPDGVSPADGTYVRYPAADLLGVLALEAHRAGAVVVAEDLGTVEDGVREELASRGILGSAVLWFERESDDSGFRPSATYRADVFASVTTHDLPTATGFWTGEATRARAELGLLGARRTVAEQEAADAREREELTSRLVAEGLAAPDAGVDDLVVAMHDFLARGPSWLFGVALGDALGEIRQPNLPGTQDEYPNWRLPLTAPSGEPILLEDLPADDGVGRMVERLARDRPRREG